MKAGLDICPDLALLDTEITRPIVDDVAYGSNLPNATVTFGNRRLALLWGEFRELHPSELTAHVEIAYTYCTSGDAWQFDGPEGRVSVKSNPCMHTKSSETCRALVAFLGERLSGLPLDS